MKVIISFSSLGNGLEAYDSIVPQYKSLLKNLIISLSKLEEPSIDIQNLLSVHFTENYEQELTAFKEKHGIHTSITKNAVDEGHAQVVNTEKGYHIFFSNLISTAIISADIIEKSSSSYNPDVLSKAKKQKHKLYITIRHELAHVEDMNNQNKWLWFDRDFEVHDLQTDLRFYALRMWEEYYACKRAFFLNSDDTEETINSINQEYESLINDLKKYEELICDIRWQYNTKTLELDSFSQYLRIHIRGALMKCCYFMGNNDLYFDDLKDKIQPNGSLPRLYDYIFEIWQVLHDMYESYPSWSSYEVFNELGSTVLKCIQSFEVYLKQTQDGVYYKVPVKRLLPRSDNC